ncbi:uncharacterized protein VICG_00937 [Vittaforma corneae ATCC 50505]|uniref:Uncharacterized protein n=1 Tax=Vittaforma corneae (strain ATCC 50505) TaxID=993615 RepID=L2GMI3_VITCO|nr:uncharacterized protein VICG_00937 [Vittaforma corneae ATCC 50505]ELA42088.1 hypothetical protein VICG_00937 [Vittaforma corneae ATCC 50505]
MRSVFSASKFSDEYVRVFEPDELFYKIDLGKIFSHAKEEKTGSNDEFLKKRQQQIHSNIRRLKICNTLFMSSAVVLVVIDSLALYTLYLKRSRNQGVTSM